MPQTIDNEILAAAIEGFEAQKRRIDAQIAQLRERMGGGSTQTAPTSMPGGKRRKMSAEGRRRIAEAQRKRWAEARKRSGGSPAAKAPKTKRRLSPEGRRRIIEATKRRWALVRAAKAAK